FSLVQRVKALFNSYKEPEAVAAFQQAVLTLPNEQAEDLSSWLCSQQLQNGCAARTGSACHHALPNEVTQDIDFERPAHALAHVLAIECKGDQNIDSASFARAVKDEDWKLFFNANVKRQKEDKTSSAELFAQVLKSESAPELLRIEAVRRWVKFASPVQ